MKNLIIILCCFILLCGLFWGHSKTCNETATNNLITKLKEGNQNLKKQLQDSKKEFSIPKENTYYIPRYFSSNTENGVKWFGTAYEIYHDDNLGYKGSLQVLYVNFKRIDGEWKLDSMEININ